jgi:hypothetical protein
MEFSSEGPAGIFVYGPWVLACDPGNNRIWIGSTVSDTLVEVGATGEMVGPIAVVANATHIWVLSRTATAGGKKVSYYTWSTTTGAATYVGEWGTSGVATGEIQDAKDLALCKGGWHTPDNPILIVLQETVAPSTPALLQYWITSSGAGTHLSAYDTTSTEDLIYLSGDGLYVATTGAVYANDYTSGFPVTLTSVYTDATSSIKGIDHITISAVEWIAITQTQQRMVMRAPAGSSTITYRIPYSDSPERGGDNEWGTFGACRVGATLTNGRFFTADTTYNRVYQMEIDLPGDGADGYLSVAQSLSEPDVPPRAPSITPSAGAGYTGTIEVCYSYKQWNQDDWYESRPSPVTKYVATAAISSVAVAVWTSATCTPTVDSVLVYVRDSITGGEFVLVDEVSITTTSARMSITLTYQANEGFTSSGAPMKSDYVLRPPTGVQFCVPYSDRMIYVKDDTLYVSHSYFRDNSHGADMVPTADSFDETPDEIGGYVRVGTDSGKIIGAAVLNTELLVLKNRGVWRLSGEASLPGFGLYNLSNVIGCGARRSVVSAENMVMWYFGDTIYAYDGNDVQEVGKPVQGVLKDMLAADKAASFAVYDPVRRWYTLYVPQSAPSDLSSVSNIYNKAIGLRYQFDLGCWTLVKQFVDNDVLPDSTEGVPGACACYAVAATTPGVYASDWWYNGTTFASSPVYRMDTGNRWPLFTGGNVYWGFTTPGMTGEPGRCMDIQRVQLWTRVGGVLVGSPTPDHYTRTYALATYANGNAGTATSTSGDITVTSRLAERTRHIMWYPALTPNALMMQTVVRSYNASTDTAEPPDDAIYQFAADVIVRERPR